MTNKNKTAQELALEWIKGFDFTEVSRLVNIQNTIINALTPPRDDAVREALEWVQDNEEDIIDLHYNGNGVQAVTTIMQALQSRVGQEGKDGFFNNDFKSLPSERVKSLMENTAYPNSRSVKQAIEQACNEIYHLNKHLRVSHPSRADAVDVKDFERDLKHELTTSFPEYKNCIEMVVEETINRLEKKSYFTQKPDGSMVNEWLPIESAPKDGTEILALLSSGEPVRIKWIEDTSNDFEGWANWQDETYDYVEEYIILWQLPPTQHLTED